ncbi:MAG: HAMP domain-containing histidine kinase [Candidatus Atribacteria bacterium]|nr:HAMP domain-containing histidine kinase [Candidatus Atribacteria bacterium]
MISSLNFLSIIITVFFVSFTIVFFIYELFKKRKEALQILGKKSGLRKNYQNYRDLTFDLIQELQQLQSRFFQMKKLCLQILDHSSLSAAFWDYQSDILQYNLSFARLVGLSTLDREEISIYELPIIGTILKNMTNESQTVEVGTMRIHIQRIAGNTDCFFMLTDLEAQEVEEREKKYLTHAIWHEMKTPLTVLKGYTQLLLEEIQEPDLLEKCQKINFQIERLEKITAQLRHLARPNQTNFPIQIQVFIDMIHQVLQSWQTEIEDHQVKVETNFEEIKEYRDRELSFSQGDLYIIATNLISNAIRFNRPHGFVSVSLRFQHKSMVFEVIDNGPGIPEEMKDLIFKPLGYASYTGEKSQGMGLYLVKEAVRRGRGRIAVQSESESGTTIRIFIPFR